MSSLELAQKIQSILEDKLGEDIRVLKVDELTTLTDFFVIVTAKSTPHLKVLIEEVDEVLSKEYGLEPFSKELSADNWLVLDYNSVILHVLTEETRLFYNLERLWEEVDITD